MTWATGTNPTDWKKSEKRSDLPMSSVTSRCMPLLRMAVRNCRSSDLPEARCRGSPGETASCTMFTDLPSIDAPGKPGQLARRSLCDEDGRRRLPGGGQALPLFPEPLLQPHGALAGKQLEEGVAVELAHRLGVPTDLPGEGEVAHHQLLGLLGLRGELVPGRAPRGWRCTS